MIGSLLNRALVLIFGYAYPAYECFKTIERSKPETEQLRFWCQYWILVAMLTVCERICDCFIAWFPMYNEAKLGLYIYLWYPKTKGALYVYDCFCKPYLAKHEPEIDRNLVELKTKAGDMAIICFQRAANYGQMRVFEILQYVVAQSSPFLKHGEKQKPRGNVKNEEEVRSTTTLMTIVGPSTTKKSASTVHGEGTPPHLSKVTFAEEVGTELGVD